MTISSFYLMISLLLPEINWSIGQLAHEKEINKKKTDNLLSQLHHFETVIPQLVDHSGQFLSYHVSHSSVLHRMSVETTRSRRSAKGPFNKTLKNSSKPSLYQEGDEQKGRSSVFYKLSAYGREFHLNLTLNRHLLTKGFAVEYIGSNQRRRSSDELWDCHYTGVSVNGDASDAAISNCNGLHGVFSTTTDDYFVEPLWNHTNVVGVEGHPHVVYSRSSLKYGDLRRYCGVTDYKRKKFSKWYRKRPDNINDILKPRKQSPFWKWRPKLKSLNDTSLLRKRFKRSKSFESFIETLVVVDKKMMDYHLTSDTPASRQNLTNYVLTIMNIVAKLYHNPSIGNAINIVVTGIFFLEAEKGDNLPQINYHADMSLDSFCKWQNNFTLRQDNETSHKHDNAVLITRYDICTYKNYPCGTLGLAPVEGMCESERSCSINQDIGLASAFTIAHEIGHNIGMQHDGDGNQCGMPGKEPARLMAARLSKETSPFHWSSCSRKYVTDFLDSGHGWCLRNIPSFHVSFSPDVPGDFFDSNTQCRLQYGAKSTACKLKQICQELWCVNESNECVTNSIPAAEGTICQLSYLKKTAKGDHSDKGWCYKGECRGEQHRNQTVHGSWGEWGEWGDCTRTCEGGVSVSERECDNPAPKDGGKYCTGVRKKYRSCNVTPCPPGSEDFRQVQCSSFNNITFRGGLYKWVPYTGEQAKPCSLVCMAEGYNFYTERSPKVKDGTKCYPDQPDVCINGECHTVGCDGYLHSKAKEDICRVCKGDNSTCRTISGLFEKALTTGSYHEILTIPKGAMHIKVKEANFSKNYLALKDARDHYHINGEWTIDWPRKFSVAGTTFHYKLYEDEPESLTALGPTTDVLNVMMLLQEDNKGIEYQYNIPINKSDDNQNNIALYLWAHFPWSPCSRTCSNGTSISKVKCILKSTGRAVDDKYCDRQPKPADYVRVCNEDACPPKWSTGQWSDCSQTCGEGDRTRQVVCRQLLGDEEMTTLDDSECIDPKPATRRECRLEECPPEWHTFEWSECSTSCGRGEMTRRVVCTSSMTSAHLEERRCRPEDKPVTRMTCMTRDCPVQIRRKGGRNTLPQWRKGEWGQCSVTCGAGIQERAVQCHSVNGDPCDPTSEPASKQKCNISCDPELDQPSVCEDKLRVAYCPLVLKSGYCTRPYFRTMCCETCSRVKASDNRTKRKKREF